MTASFPLTLDTQPPVLTIDAPSTITPPDHVEITISSNEPICLAATSVQDSSGQIVHLGVEWADSRTVLLSMPTTGLSGGSAEISVTVADEVLNSTQQVVTVYIDRPRAFDVALTIGNAFDGGISIEGAYEIESLAGTGHGVDFTLDEPYDVNLDVFR